LKIVQSWKEEPSIRSISGLIFQSRRILSLIFRR
jgi:hypothetical protein